MSLTRTIGAFALSALAAATVASLTITLATIALLFSLHAAAPLLAA